MTNGKHYLLTVAKPNFVIGTTDPKMGDLGSIIDWSPQPGAPGKSFTLVVETGANLPGPTVHVMATKTNAYGPGNLAGSRIRYRQTNGVQTSRAVLGLQAL